MHSRIIQVSKTPNPKHFTEDRYYQLFVGEIADYVEEITEEEYVNDAFEWLAHLCSNAIQLEEDGFTVIDRAAYFKPRYAKFVESLNSLSKIQTFDKFMDSLDMSLAMYSLNDAYDDKYGFYIDFENYGHMPLDSFMRMAKNGTRYYFGAVFDYHF